MILAFNFVLYAVGIGAEARFVLTGVGGIAYNGLLDGGPTGQTFGKKILKVRVVDDDTASPIGTGRGMGRALVPVAIGVIGVTPLLGLVAFVLGLLDGLWPLWDARRQTWHDKAVGSVVVVA